VEDAALVLSVMAARTELADPAIPGRTLRIAVSTRAPAVGASVSREWKHAAEACARALEDAGHTVAHADPPYGTAATNMFLARWFSGVAADAAAYDRSRMERRSRGHVRAGRLVQRRLKEELRERWRARMDGFFDGYDVLVTPTLARFPPKAEGWSRRSWAANLWAASRYAPMCAPWNLAGFPGASVPFGRGREGMPLAVQLVAPEGGESSLLSLAKQLEQLQPWPRTAPLP